MPNPFQRIPAVLSWLAAAFLIFRGVPALWDVSASSARLPFWDMAKYGLSGLRLYEFADQGRWLSVLGELNEMSVWPPFWPVVSALGFAVLGPDFSTPRLLMVIVWAGIVAASVWAPRPLRGGAWVGSAVAAWFFVGPMFQSMATLNLLELPGLLLTVLVFGSYLRALESPPGRLGWWRATAFWGLCLMLCKYNYGLMWWVPWAVCEARRRFGSWAKTRRGILRALARLPWRSPLGLGATSLLAVILVVRWTGGGRFFWLGQEVSLTSAGVPAYLLYLLCLFGILRSPEMRSKLQALRDEDGVLLKWLGLPLALWFLVPNHVKDLAGFLENRSSDLGAIESLAFYPEALLSFYAADPVVGLLVASAACLGLRELSGSSDARRLVALCWLVGALALLTHPYKLPRFALHTAWWTAALAAVTSARSLWSLGPMGRRLAASAALLSVALAWGAGVATDRVEARHRQWTVPESVRPMIEEWADSASPREGPVLILGTWNGLSPALIEMVARFRASETQARLPLPRTDFEIARRDPDRLLEVLGSGRFSRVVVMIYRANPAFEQETFWLKGPKELLEEETIYRLVSESRSQGEPSAERYEWRQYQLRNLFNKEKKLYN